jgi:hypothetical protein
MPFQFSNPAPYRFKAGDIFLGLDDQGHEVGITTDRHAVATGGARTGKGAALIVPNLLRWQTGAMVIDPKGENIEKTWEAREAMGQKVIGLDPFQISKIPARLRGGFNPLADLSPQTPRVRERLMVLADGMVVSHDPKHMDWVEGTRAIIAGVMAFNVTTADDEFRNLSLVRKTLLLSDDQLLIEAQEMMQCLECGGLAVAAGQAILAALNATSNTIEKQCLQKARAVTRWLDSPEIAAMLSHSTFSLDELRGGKLSLYVVLNADDIEHYGTLFRMIVRTALASMMAGGSGNNARVLFILDEFFSIGKLDVVAKSAGLMPSYGVHLLPILQDLGQLHELYGAKGAETFFGNADAHIFFGTGDPLTLQYVSDRIGKVRPDEAVATPPALPTYQGRHFNSWTDKGWFEDEKTARERFEAEQRNAERLTRTNVDQINSQYQHAMRLAGQPRVTPSEVAGLVGRGHDDKVARSMIVFAKTGDILNLRLAPYFSHRVRGQGLQLGRRLHNGFAYRLLSNFKRRDWLILLGLVVLWAMADMIRQGHGLVFVGQTLFSIAFFCGFLWVFWKLVVKQVIELFRG